MTDSANPQSGDDSRPVLSETEKLFWEVEKLKVEVATLKKPWLSRPGSWIAVVTTLAAVSGFGFQYSRSELKNERAELALNKAIIQQEQVADDTALLEVEKESVALQLSQAQETLDQVNSQHVEAEKLLSDTKNELDRLLQLITSVATHLDEHEFELLTGSIAAVQESVGETNKLVASGKRQSEEAKDSLAAIESASLKNTVPKVFAVIASYETEREAQNSTKRLRRKYPSEYFAIYLSNNNYYAVTIGRPTGFKDAEAIVIRAKSDGLASDAYVRITDGWKRIELDS